MPEQPSSEAQHVANQQRVPGRASGLVAPFRSRNFTVIWLSQTIALLGAQFYLVTQSWLILDLSGSSLTLGTLLTLTAVPRALLLPISGVLTDRLRPKTMLVLAGTVLTLVTGLLSVLVFAGKIASWMLMPLALTFGVTSAVYLPASFAILPAVVDRSLLQAANAFAQMTNQASLFVGPGLAGALVGRMGVGAAYAVMAGAFALSGALVSILRLHPTLKGGCSARKATPLEDLREGLAALKTRPLLLVLILLSGMINLGIMGPLQVGLPALTRGTLQAGAKELGLLLSSFGFGSLLGSFLAGAFGRTVRRAWVAMVFGAILGMLWTGVGLADNFYVAAAVLTTAGFCAGVLNVIFITLLQTLTPTHVLGRIVSLQLMGSTGLQPVSFVLSGWATEVVGLRVLFFVGGGLVTAACVAGMILPSVHNADA